MSAADKAGAILVVLALGLLCPALAQKADPKVAEQRIPFVGCKSDGQQGPIAAPKGAARLVQIKAAAANTLAYYKAEYSPGVLAPRGWNCFGLYGSSGASLYVAPQPLTMQSFMSDGWQGFDGAFIKVEQWSGDTSGRFEVARLIARVFPAQKAFVDGVISEGIEPANNFPFGPFKTDRLTNRNERTVEFETPPHATGLGTFDRVQAIGDAIRGVAMLQGATPDALLLTLRLPTGRAGSAADIVAQFERENRRP